MDELTVIKRELKCWENMFERKHGRKPTKDDIRDAPAEIKDTYVKYKHLKEDVNNTKEKKNDSKDDGVFGKSLNKKYDKKPLPLASVRLKNGLENIKSVRLCHGQRPKMNAKKKSFEEEQIENKINTNDGEKKNEVNNSVCDVTAFGLNAVAISTSSKSLGTSQTPSQITSKIRKTPGAVESRLKRRASLFAASLKKMEHQNESEKPTENQANIEMDVAMETEFESETDNRKEPVRKACLKEIKRKDEDGIQKNDNYSLQEKRDFATLRSNTEMSRKETSVKSDGESSDLINDEQMPQKDNAGSVVGPELYSCEFPTSLSTKEILCHSNVSERELNGRVEGQEIENQDSQNAKKRKAEKDISEDVKIPELKKLRTEKLEEETPSSWEGSLNEMDDLSEDECHSDEGPSDTFEEVNMKTNSSKSRPSSSSLVSDNFVRLDMKHKSYRRRGNGMTGSAYKRRAWATMMKARGEYVSKSSWSRKRGGGGGRGGGRGSWGGSRGTTSTCYKCDKEGHWAKNCKGGQTVREIPDEDEDNPEFAPEDDDFIQQLTFEKAAQMAAGVSVDESEDPTHPSSLVILPHHLPRPVYVPPPGPDAIEPLYQTVGGNIIDTPKEVFSALGQLGFSSFRSGQEQAIMRILSGVSSLVVLSTGAGKSLCYQLPAYMYFKRFPCLTLVISPLVSLMEDQIGGLPFGLKGACLHTNQTKPQRAKILENISSGKIAVLLLSPEALVGSGSGSGCLPPSTRLPPIAFACIDEAHCLSEWSHNFRPSYLRVCKVLRERFGVRCFLGLTATATRSTAASVAQHLGICNDEGAIIRGAAVPPNLYLSVSRDRDRDKALIELLQGPRFSQCESIIIYCTRREETERVATLVRTCLQHMTPTVKPVDMKIDQEPTKRIAKKRKKNVPKAPLTWEAESYHAGMSAAQRRRVQKRFMSGELRLVVATVAFGMGLDKSDVRAIIHYNMPKSFESYVQEIGRAGRDGLPSHCHVFLEREGKDMYELRRHIHSNTVDRITLKKLVNKVFPRCDCTELLRAQKAREKLNRETQDPKQENEEKNEDDEFVSDDILSQISEEQMADKTADVEGGAEKHTDTMKSCRDGKSEDNADKLSRDLESNNLDNKSLANAEKNSKNCSSSSLGRGRNLKNGDSERGGEDAVGDHTQEGGEGEGGDHTQGGGEGEGGDHTQGGGEGEGGDHTQGGGESFANITELDSNEVNTSIKEDNFGQPPQNPGMRACGGHDVAIATESAVQELDMPEESIATLLCYLELHSNRWIEVLRPVKGTCTVKFYGGHAHLRAVAKRIPPIAAAVAYCEKKESKFKKQSSLSFPVVEIADKMGWDLDPVFKELRALQWNSSLAPDSKLSSTGQSGILVEFSDNSMHIRAPGDLSNEERDEVCDFLDDRIQAEERTQLKQLNMLYSSLKKVSCSEYWQCSEEIDKENDQELKTMIKAYFDDLNNATQIELEIMKKRRESDACVDENTRDEHVNWDGLARDIRVLTSIHHDQSFTGRAVARIFHGISSPCYPAEVWGRDRRFWRKHLDVDFNSLRRFAIRELMKLR